MPDLIFNKSTGQLSWPAIGKYWGARSGPYGLGALPSGKYTVGRREITDYTSSIGVAFKDQTGKGFFVPIYPNFSTTRGSSGGRLGIHPDGNVPGTQGCIGLTDHDTYSFYDAVRNTSASVNLMLEVK